MSNDQAHLCRQTATVERTDNTENPKTAESDSGAALGAASGSAITFSPEPLYEWSYVRDLSPNSVLIPWLNLLFLAPELASSEGQVRWVARPTIKKQVYGILLECKFGQKLKILEERLKHIFPHSFLFRLSPQQIEYRNVLNGQTTIRSFVELVHQILCVDLKKWTVEGTGLAEGIRKLYSQIPEQIQRNSRHQIDDVFEELSEHDLCLDDSLWDETMMPNVEVIREDQRGALTVVVSTDLFGRFLNHL